MIAQKRKVSVTLYVECYDDLDLEDINWRELLDLQGDESIHASIKDHDPFWSCDSLIGGTSVVVCYNAITLVLYEYFMAGGVAMYCRPQGYPSPHLIVFIRYHSTVPGGKTLCQF